MKLYCSALLPIFVVIILPIIQEDKPKELPVATSSSIDITLDDIEDMEQLIKSGYNPEEISIILGD